MPGFEMTAEEANRYGATLNIWQAMRLLQAWAPLIAYGRRFVGEIDPYKKGLIVGEACEWLASQTDSQLDDQLVRHITEVAKSPQGEALVRFALGLAGVQ